MRIETVKSGDVYLSGSDDFHTADIDVEYARESFHEMKLREHPGGIACFGDGVKAAEALRDRVLLTLTLHDELVDALRKAYWQLNGGGDLLKCTHHDAWSSVKAVLDKLPEGN